MMCIRLFSLRYTKQSGSPFFLGVGFHKPHIPWTIPTRFFQPLGSIDSQALPKHERSPLNMPPMAWNKGLGHHALDSYADANRWPLHSFANGSNVAFPQNLTKAMRRGYYAAVSYTDWLTGNLLDALDATGLANSTVVTIMGDHGYVKTEKKRLERRRERRREDDFYPVPEESPQRTVG